MADKEKLSALMDGETIDKALIVDLESDQESMDTWQSYHLIGDVMRVMRQKLQSGTLLTVLRQRLIMSLHIVQCRTCTKCMLNQLLLQLKSSLNLNKRSVSFRRGYNSLDKLPWQRVSH